MDQPDIRKDVRLFYGDLTELCYSDFHSLVYNTYECGFGSFGIYPKSRFMSEEVFMHEIPQKASE